MPQQAKLIGCEAMTGGAIRFHVAFVIFDVVFHLSAGTVDLLVEPLGARLLQIGNNEAGVDALVGDLDFDDDPARARPCPGLGPHLVKARDLAPIARGGSLGLLDNLASESFQDGVAGQSGDITEMGLCLDPRHDFGVGKVAVTANDQQGIGPRVPQVCDRRFNTANLWAPLKRLALKMAVIRRPERPS